MQAVIISIGDEILNGTTLNTNASWIALQIQPLGINTQEVLSISDNHTHILAALNRYMGNVDVIFITGGLGPTKDDITKYALCEFFESQLVFHEDIYLKLKHAFEKRNFPFAESNRSQAMYPHNCVLLKNSMGSAQGMWFEKNNTVVLSMPGVPFEMKAIMQEQALNKIQTTFQLPVIINSYLMTSGMGESWIAQQIEEIENSLPPYISLAYLPSPCVVKLRLTAKGTNRNLLQTETDKFSLAIKNKLGDVVYSDKQELLEEHIGTLLHKLQSTVSTAESCTGGKIAHKITSIPGCSNYYPGSVITYSYELKTQLLGVQQTTLEKFGAVSAETVGEMLDGVLRTTQTDFAIAVSGIAGPDGGTASKPVGTVYIGVANKNEKRITKHFFNKNRDVNIEYTCMYALHELRMLLLDTLAMQGN